MKKKNKYLATYTVVGGEVIDDNVFRNDAIIAEPAQGNLE